MRRARHQQGSLQREKRKRTGETVWVFRWYPIGRNQEVPQGSDRHGQGVQLGLPYRTFSHPRLRELNLVSA